MSSTANTGFPGTEPIGAPESLGQPFSVDGPFNSVQPGGSPSLQEGPTSVPEIAAPTWRDLPYEPPYGPVPPPRTPNIHDPETPVVVEDDPTISAKQIALAIGGLLLLIALGIGGALFLLNDESPEVAQNDPAPAIEDPAADLPQPDPLPATEAPAPNQGQGQLEPSQPTPDSTDPAADDPAAQDPSAQDPTPQDPGAEDGSTGAEPGEPGAAEPGAAEPGAAEPGSEDQGGQTPPEPNDPAVPEQAPGQDQPAEQDQPDAIPPPDTPPQDQPDIELPRLFELRQLPAGTDEGTTTVRQTSSDDSESVTEQTTILDTDSGEEYSVVATRAEDAAERYDRVAEDAARELTVTGQDAVITEDGNLAYLVEGDVDTLIVIDGPDSAEVDALVVVAQGLELQQ